MRGKEAEHHFFVPVQEQTLHLQRDISAPGACADEETVAKEGLLAAQMVGSGSAQALPQQAVWSES